MVREHVPDEVQIKLMDDAESGAMSAHQIDWTQPEKSVSDDELISFVLHQYTVGKARRYQWEREAAVQMAWVKGYQHLIWSHERRSLIDSESDADMPLEQRKPVSINKLSGFVLTWIGMMMGGGVSFNVYPQTNENDDISNAKIQGKLIRHYFGASHIQGQTRLMEALWTMFATGIVFARPTFDPFAGGEDWYSAGMMAERGEEDTEEMRQTWRQRLVSMVAKKRKVNPRQIKLDKDGLVLPKGEIDTKWLTGFDVTEPLHCKNIPTAPWIIESCFIPVEILRQRYPDRADELVADNEDVYRRHNRYEADLGRRNSDMQAGVMQAEDVLVHYVWRPRIHRICPYGFCGAVTNNGTVLKKGKNPYVHGRIPIIAFKQLPDPDNFRPPCVVRDLMSLQKARNERRSLIQGYMRETIDPRILVKKGSGIPDDLMSRWPKTVPVNADQPLSECVRAVDLPPPPAYLAQLDQMDEADMESVANIHRSTMGEQEGSGQSGRHALAMQAGDRLVAAPTRLLIQDAGSEYGSQVMALIWQYYDEDRTIGIVGERGAYEVMTFKGRSLLSRPPVGPHSVNVRCVLSPQREPKDVQDFVKGMVEIGVFDPANEEHRATILRYVNTELPPETDEDAEHTANAARENAEMMAGGKARAAIRAAYGDNDAAHIREHERLTTTGKFRQAAANDPLLGMAVWMHIQEHIFGRILKVMQPQSMAAQVQAYLQKLAPPPPPTGAPGAPAAAPSAQGNGAARQPGNGQANGRPMPMPMGGRMG